MYQSSSTIGAIAGALAKAQSELTNPDKSLTATVQLTSRSEGERAFRYAPLSSGLDIVRKCLGKHEIAAIQTTTIDKDCRMVRLTTVLAHTSGEWVSSDWPVCTIAEVGSPRRMGAALTYARRYALFTIVGIAGEDDLDAPDLDRGRPNGGEKPPVNSMNGDIDASAQRNAVWSGRRPAPVPKPPLKSEESAKKREDLIAELNTLVSAEELVEWARRVMSVKNGLSQIDANALEETFQARMASVTESGGLETGSDPSANSLPTSESRKKTKIARRRSDRSPKRPESRTQLPYDSAQSIGIDKSVLAIATLKRHRSKPHLRFVASQACLVCGREPSDAHHLRFAQPRGLGQKVSDEYTVPLCRVHHREVHSTSKEREWWNKMNIDPLTTASALWQKSTA